MLFAARATLRPRAHFLVIKVSPLAIDIEDDVEGDACGLAVRGKSDDTKTGGASRSDRVRKAVDEHYELVWRSLRRFGVQESSVDDAAQQVLIVLSRRIDGIAPGAERSFMLSTAIRVAADHRKKQARSREVLDGVDTEARTSPLPTPDVLLDRERARQLLDVVLDELTDELRVVFVLFELEEMTMRTIAETLALPSGTVASRLRRARERFEAIAERLCPSRSDR